MANFSKSIEGGPARGFREASRDRTSRVTRVEALSFLLN